MWYGMVWYCTMVPYHSKGVQSEYFPQRDPVMTKGYWCETRSCWLYQRLTESGISGKFPIIFEKWRTPSNELLTKLLTPLASYFLDIKDYESYSRNIRSFTIPNETKHEATEKRSEEFKESLMIHYIWLPNIPETIHILFILRSNHGIIFVAKFC